MEKVSRTLTHHTSKERVQDLPHRSPQNDGAACEKRSGLACTAGRTDVLYGLVQSPQNALLSAEFGKESCATSFGLQGRADDCGVNLGRISTAFWLA